MLIAARLLSNLEECVRETLESYDALPGCWLGVVPGTAVLQDYAWECGAIGWVRLISGYNASQVGEPQRVEKVSSLFGFDIEVGILRVVGVTDGTLNADPPEAEEMTEVALAAADDMIYLRKGIECCETVRAEGFLLGSYLPAGPLGGLTGGAWTLSIGL